VDVACRNDLNASNSLRFDCALGATAAQSSTASELFIAQNAISNDLKCTSTAREEYPWWRIDLGVARSVDELEVETMNLRLALPVTERLEVRVGMSVMNDGNSNHLCGSPSLANGVLHVNCGGALGRYVNIQLTDHGVLSLCNVHVWTSKPVSSSMVNVAQYRPLNTSVDVAPEAICLTTIPSDSPTIVIPLQLPAVVNHVTILSGGWVTPLMSVSVGDKETQTLCDMPTFVKENSTVVFDCHNQIGSDVMVTAHGWNQVLSVCEMQVWGRLVANGPL